MKCRIICRSIAKTYHGSKWSSRRGFVSGCVARYLLIPVDIGHCHCLKFGRELGEVFLRAPDDFKAPVEDVARELGFARHLGIAAKGPKARVFELPEMVFRLGVSHPK